MKLAPLLGCLSGLVLVARLALAQDGWSEDARLCYATRGDLTLKIAYCSRAIESGKLSNANLSITYVNRGGTYEAQGDMERALADFNTAIRVDSTNSQAWVALGRYFRSTGQEGNARAQFDRAIGLPIAANDARGYLDRARAHRAKGDLSAALADLDSAGTFDGKLREVYTERGGIYSTRRTYDRAITEYDEALRLDSADAPVLIARGDSRLNLGHYRAALADYDAAIVLEPAVARYYATRGWSHRVLGDPNAAIADYTTAIRLEPNHGFRYTGRAGAYRQKGDWKDAMSDYDHAVQVEPDRGRYHDSRGDAREYEGNYVGALADRDEAIRLEPRDADWRVYRAWTLLYAGKPDASLAGFGDAITLDPSAAARYVSRGDALELLGRFDDAVTDFDRAIQLEPTRGTNYANRAWVALYRRQPLDGLKDLDRADAADPEYATGSNRGFLLLSGLRLDDALAAYTAYTAQRPNATDGYKGRGVVYMVKGDLRAAVTELRHATDFNAWDSQLVLLLHWARARAGEPDSGATAVQAHRTDPRKWPGAALRYALGAIPLDSMLASAREPSAIRTREQEAEAYFYAGEHYLAVKQPLIAQKMFREVVLRNTPWQLADASARAELAALSK
jgi:tetratricopeptide (TPR) repeat protein